MAVIQRMERGDWSRVREIYVEGIRTRRATFETSAPGWEEWDASHLPCCRLVAVRDADVVGWAALSPYSSRCVYDGVAEASVYVAARHRGEGIGSLLLERLIAESESEGIWTLQGGIFPENAASIALCRKMGFREVGRRERIGRLDGEWKDVLLLERRSPVVGV